jgi:23S rRNA pseudouridine2604 synthase
VQQAEPREEDGRVRLSKLMSEQGLASRREADEWIEQGWVRVDGEVVDELGTRVFPHQHISIDKMASTQQAQRVTVLLHKPIGYVSGQAEDGYEPAITLIRPENRWADDKLPIELTRGHLRNLAPAGRLDIDSTGLLVLTQDGRIAKHLIGEDSGVEKEYLVRVQWMEQPEAENVAELVPSENIDAMRFGLELDGKPLKPAQVSWQNEQQLRVVLREGRKRQIRRMCEIVGLKVVGLKRVRMGRITLSKLPVGQWRFLRPDERF